MHSFIRSHALKTHPLVKCTCICVLS